ncbi:MAG TPA: 4-(cytidine 5'-diphospho)-2-C-methyl-D-erythritol kinase [Spirochaetota bacterium]|nr:4-(cytidine 5'-diphospho)-2-C-methyl-D-erythritol kinase [Spirochaetota bacterium]
MLSEIKAHAKINLHLNVLNRREDSYHNIISIMACVKFYDLLKLMEVRLDNRADGPVSILIEPDSGLHDEILKDMSLEENLVYKAAALYLHKAKMSGTVIFSLSKNIPAGAGLGGGSSDAAAALRLLNNHLGLFDESQLHTMAASLGADVPFCLQGGAALVEKTGEKLTSLSTPPFQGYVLLACPGIHVHTGKAYAALNRDNSFPAHKAESIRNRLRVLWDEGNLESLVQVLANDFEKFVFTAHPRVKGIYEQLAGTDPIITRMTGSGSTLFALYHTEAQARSAKDFLSGKVADIFITQFCD